MTSGSASTTFYCVFFRGQLLMKQLVETFQCTPLKKSKRMRAIQVGFSRGISHSHRAAIIIIPAILIQEVLLRAPLEEVYLVRVGSFALYGTYFLVNNFRECAACHRDALGESGPPLNELGDRCSVTRKRISAEPRRRTRPGTIPARKRRSTPTIRWISHTTY